MSWQHIRYRIYGAIGVVWGGAMLVLWWPQRSGVRMSAYPLVFGALLLLVGGYYLITGGRRRKAS